MTTIEMYRAEFVSHIEKGDDETNAELRIVEQGCPPAIAAQIRREEGDDEEDDDNA